jgi:NAD(P)H-hydrate epimerase
MIQEFVVTADEMRAIEGRVFAAGMPVAGLMEKVGCLITQRIIELYPHRQQTAFGILVGPGHNGGDALVVARELYHRGYTVRLYCPFARTKDLTAAHMRYALGLEIPQAETIASLQACDVLIDGLFGFGLERHIAGESEIAIAQINQWSKPVLSIDLPSGLHTDTGDVLGVAIRASRTFCLGLWKRGVLQDHALDYLGQVELIPFDIPRTHIHAVLGADPPLKRMTSTCAIAHLPLQRSPDTHKYKVGHLLLIAGSHQFIGAAILSALGGRASGVGMLTVAVPDTLKTQVTHHLPDAVVIGCPATETGAISLPEHLVTALQHGKYSAIACGPGLTKAATDVVNAVLTCPCPLILDADGLTILADLQPSQALLNRPAPTVLTPHAGEFKRLFPELAEARDRITMTQKAAQQANSILLLKGARTVVADAQGLTWLNSESTPAVARGGSGDVLTGLMGGVLAQSTTVATSELPTVVASAAWWHAQAGLLAAQERTVLGVDALTLSQYLLPTLKSFVTA